MTHEMRSKFDNLTPVLEMNIKQFEKSQNNF